MVQIIDLTGIEKIGNCILQVAAMYAPKLLIPKQDQGRIPVQDLKSISTHILDQRILPQLICT